MNKNRYAGNETKKIHETSIWKKIVMKQILR